MKMFAKLISIVIVCFLFLKTYGQQSQLTLDHPLIPGDYKARDEVKAIEGTDAILTGTNPTANEIHLFIDPSIQLDANYQLNGVNYPSYNPSFDYSLPVGTIKGTAGVTPTGQATYDIPIQVPPGTRGMAPSIGITYNSAAPDGIMGRGWNLKGISVINRIPKDIYHDGSCAGITLDPSDAFSLDGTRLIEKQQNEYKLENDNFSKITYDVSGNFFKVETKDGMTMEFGNTSNSRLILANQNVCYAWYLNKVYDKYNNYIYYNYYNSNHEVAIKEINYIGNAVKFYYDKREDKCTRYLLNNPIPSTLILRQIKVACEAKYMKSYDFKYGFNSQTFLNEIIESGSDNTKINATVIKYGSTDPPPPPFSLTKIFNFLCQSGSCDNNNTDHCEQQSSPYTFKNDAIVHFELLYSDNTSGNCPDPQALAQIIDINNNGSILESKVNQTTSFDMSFKAGDKIQALISTQNMCVYSLSATITEAVGNSLSISTPVTTGGVSLVKNADYVSGDFNGDGKSDLLAFVISNFTSWGSRVYSGWELYINQDDGTTFTKYSNLPTLPSNYSPYSLQDFFSGYSSKPSSFGMQTADFNGDGLDDILLGEEVTGNYKKFTVYYSNGNNFSAGIHTLQVSSTYEQFTLADIDGDNKPEGVVYQKYQQGLTLQPLFKVFNFETGALAMSDNPPTTVYTPYPGTGAISNMVYNGLAAGDFDGDGTQEILTSRLDPATGITGGLAMIKLKIGLFIPTQISAVKEIYANPAPLVYYAQQYFGDMNGDGMTDNLRIYNSCQSLCAGLFPSNGVGFANQEYLNTLGVSSFAKNKRYIIGDINNDGKSDIISLYQGTPLTARVVYGGQTDMQAVVFSPLTGTSISFPDAVDYNYPYDAASNSNYPDPPDYPTDINLLSEFLTGDFDGDGRTDVFFKTDNNGQRAILYFNKGSTRQLATTILDGIRNETNYSYATLANGGSDVYVKSSGGAYPVIDTQFPMYVVSESSTSDGVGNLITSEYKYEGAKIHIRGKGFLGFNKFSVTNNTTNIKVENSYSDLLNQSTYFERSPLTTKTYILPSGVEIASDTYFPVPTFEPTTSGSNGAHYLKINGIISTNNTSKTETKTFGYDLDGNIAYSSTEIPLGVGTEKKEITTVYEHAGTWDNILNVPNSVTTVITRTGGGGTYMRKIDYDYDSNTGALVKTTTDPLTSNEVITELKYYTSGVCSTKTVSAVSSCTTCVQKNYSFEYDNNYRFVTKSTNPLNQVTETKYDSRWGVPLSVTDIAGLTTRYAYDGYGRNIKTVTPDNLTSSVNYHWVQPGSMPSQADKLLNNQFCIYSVTASQQGSPVVKTYFDQLGRELETESEGFNNSIIYSQKKYDTKGNLWKQTATYESSSTPLITTNTYNDDQDHPNMLLEVSTTDGAGITNNTGFGYSYPGNGKVMVTITTPDSKETTRTTDATGKIIAVTDNMGDGNIAYDYSSNGNVKQIDVNGVTSNSMTYDPFGNQHTLTDKNSGTTTYVHDAYGQLISQTDARQNQYTMLYDQLGRIWTKTGPNGAYTYEYVQSGNGINQLDNITGPGNISYSYTYDQLQRPLTYTENINSMVSTTTYEYDSYNNISETTFPNGFSTVNEYDSHGFLNNIKNGQTKAMIWQANEMNQVGQFTKYTQGNTQTQVTYNSFGFTEDINAGNDLIHHLKMTFDPANGNLINRMDMTGTRNFQETFHYDDLDRLDESNGIAGLINIIYNPDGTIEQKTDIGNYYSYHSNHPDGVEYITNSSVISPKTQDINYTTFNKVNEIIEENNLLSLTYGLDISYGPDQQRVKTILNDQQGNTIATKYFDSAYEKLITGGHTYEINYINAPTGLCAMYVTTDGDAGVMYYVYTDHLGSILKVTNGTSTGTYEQSFDAWGRNRKPDDWSYSNIPSVPVWLYRGYTGHEHLPEFNLINMNGRLYDPINGTMLSPDNYVDASASSAGYNRYAYVLNNPLKYTDPSGNGPEMLLALALFGFGSILDHTLNAGYYGHTNFWSGVKAGVAQGFNAYNQICSVSSIPVYQGNGFTISVGPSLTGFGIAGGVSYSTGDWTLGIGGGSFYDVGSSVGAGVSYYNDDKNIGFSIYGSHFGPRSDFFGESIGSQNTGGFSFRSGDVSVGMDNDFFAFQHEDRWRTGGFQIGIGDVIISSQIYENDPDAEKNVSKDPHWDSRVDYEGRNMSGKLNRPDGNEQLGAWCDGLVYRSTLSIGYKSGNVVAGIGINNKLVQDKFQNTIHRYVWFGSQNYYNNYSQFQKPGFYGFSDTYNPYSIYGYH